MQALILAAGMGKRLGALTRDNTKCMVKVNGVRLIERMLDQLSRLGVARTVIVVGYKGEEIVNHIGGRYHYAWQREQLGTGHAVMQCADDFRGYEGTVLVTFGDMPLFRRESMKAMCEFHEAKKAACTLLTAVNPELAMWARIVRDGQGRFRSIVEGKDCTPEQSKIKELFAGVLVFDSRLLFDYLPRLGTANVQHEYYLTEIPEMMAADGLSVELFPTDDPDDLRGINTPDDVVVCENILKKRIEKK